jgi:hypothetical protein
LGVVQPEKAGNEGGALSLSCFRRTYSSGIRPLGLLLSMAPDRAPVVEDLFNILSGNHPAVVFVEIDDAVGTDIEHVVKITLGAGKLPAVPLFQMPAGAVIIDIAVHGRAILNRGNLFHPASPV